MRITGGAFRGREVISKSKRHDYIRPTSSKVREAIFNILYHGKSLVEFRDEDLIKDKVIADIYCGTGILGIESFSRGAKNVVFADKDGEAISIAKKNCQKFDCLDGAFFIKANGVNLPLTPVKIDLVLMDPPYEKYLVKATLKSLRKSNWLNDGCIIIAEHSKLEELKSLHDFKLLEQKQYNNTVISIFRFCGVLIASMEA